MNTMNIPGFTAEISLYKHGTSYRMWAGGSGNDSSRVIPQLPKWFKCGVAIAAQTAACAAGGPADPLCWIAAGKSAVACL
jgi:hypothetical protein